MPRKPGIILNTRESNFKEGGLTVAMKKYITLLAVAVLLAVTFLTASASDAPIRAIREMDAIPAGWGPMENSSEAAFIRELTGGGLKISSDLVTDFQDVTAEYAGNDLYGVPDNGVRGYAYRITLNENACWDDDEAITADRWIDSAKKLLEAGNEDLLILANAEGYVKGETHKPQVLSLGEAGYGTVAAAQEAGITEFFVDMENYWGLGHGWYSIHDITRYRDHAMMLGYQEMYVSPAWLYNCHLADEQPYAYFQSEFVGIAGESIPLTWEDVGLVKTGDYELTLILDDPVTPAFLAMRLEGLTLIREKCAYAGPEVGASYGPYRVTEVTDQEILLERNPAWWGEPGPYDQILCR